MGIRTLLLHAPHNLGPSLIWRESFRAAPQLFDSYTYLWFRGSCRGTEMMIVDDHAIARACLQQVLDQSGEFEVVGQAADGEEAVRVAADVSPDVVVMDVIMPKEEG